MQAGSFPGEGVCTPSFKSIVFGLVVSVFGAAAEATVINSDTLIGPADFSYENQDVVISNCTVTIDGPHAFETLRVATGSTLTHSPATNGTVSTYAYVSDEAQILSATNEVTLANSNVVTGTILVRDSTHTITYSNNIDYLLGVSNAFTTLARTATSSIPDGSTVLVSYSYASLTTNGGLNLTVLGDFQIEAGAFIKADGHGYDNAGPGRGGSSGSPNGGTGGSYGGYGGLSRNDSVEECFFTGIGI